MPQLPPARRGAGPQRPRSSEALDYDRDWSVPTDAATLQRRPPRPVPDQSRYGRRPGRSASPAELALLDAADQRAQLNPELGL